MAAATIAVGPTQTVWGNVRVVFALLTAPADTNTFATGLNTVYGVLLGSNSASTVAADSYGYTVSGGTVTLELAGTARDTFILAIGI